MLPQQRHLKELSLFRVPKQTREFLAEVHHRSSETVAATVKEAARRAEVDAELGAVIDRAAQEFLDGGGSVARVVVEDGSPQVVVDEPDKITAADRCFKHDDEVVLVIDENTAQVLDDLTLVVIDTEDGERLSFQRGPLTMT